MHENLPMHTEIFRDKSVISITYYDIGKKEKANITKR